MNKNCRNSRTRNDIEMKLEPVTKFDQKNTATSKEFDDDFIPTNYDAILIFLANA